MKSAAIIQKSVIAPSLLAADMARLGEESQAVIDAGADFIHVDVMDNHYVPNLSFGPAIVQALRAYGITVPLDVHLMIKPVDHIIPAFINAGASYISFHPEASEHIDRTLQLIHDHGCKSGLVFNPATALDVLHYVINKVDLVLLMSVNPGFGGQSFIRSVLKKIKVARKIIDASGRDIRLEVDGGITLDNIGEIAMAGTDTFVTGSAVFGSEDYGHTIAAMRAQIARAKTTEIAC